MPGVEGRSFDQADETRTPPKTKIEIVRLGSTSASRVTLEPGWSWAECIKPIVGTEKCMSHHVGTVQSGRLRVVHADGSEGEVGVGDFYAVEPGHEAWVAGNEPFVAFEFDAKTAETYAKS